MKNNEYEGFKITKLDSECPSDYKCSWDVIGVRDEYKCPECEYLGTTCNVCGGER